MQEKKSQFDDFIKLGEDSLMLDDKNWDAWRAQMIKKFDRCGLIGYVNGKIRRPTDYDPEIMANWSRNDNLARVLISWNVTPPFQGHLLDCTSAHEMWKSLEYPHRPQGPRGVKTKPAAQVLWRELFSTTAKEGDNIVEHLEKLKQCRAQISFEALGGKRFEISDSLFSTIIATSLPPSWDSFTQSLLEDVDDIWMASPQRFMDLIGQVYRDCGHPARDGKTKLNTMYCKVCKKHDHDTENCGQPRDDKNFVQGSSGLGASGWLVGQK